MPVTIVRSCVAPSGARIGTHPERPPGLSQPGSLRTKIHREQPALSFTVAVNNAPQRAASGCQDRSTAPRYITGFPVHAAVSRDSRISFTNRAHSRPAEPTDPDV